MRTYRLQRARRTRSRQGKSVNTWLSAGSYYQTESDLPTPSVNKISKMRDSPSRQRMVEACYGVSLIRQQQFTSRRQKQENWLPGWIKSTTQHVIKLQPSCQVENSHKPAEASMASVTHGTHNII